MIPQIDHILSHTVTYCHIQPTCVIVYNDLYVQTTSSSLVFETSKRKHLIKSQLVSVINSCQNPKHNNHQLMGGHHSTGQLRLLQVMPGHQNHNDWLLTKKNFRPRNIVWLAMSGLLHEIISNLLDIMTYIIYIYILCLNITSYLIYSISIIWQTKTYIKNQK